MPWWPWLRSTSYYLISHLSDFPSKLLIWWLGFGLSLFSFLSFAILLSTLSYLTELNNLFYLTYLSDSILNALHITNVISVDPVHTLFLWMCDPACLINIWLFLPLIQSFTSQLNWKFLSHCHSINQDTKSQNVPSQLSIKGEEKGEGCSALKIATVQPQSMVGPNNYWNRHMWWMWSFPPLPNRRTAAQIFPSTWSQSKEKHCISKE